MSRLLVIRLGAQGDLIHVLPSLMQVKAFCPDVELHLLTSSEYKQLTDLMPDVDQAWVWSRKTGWLGWLQMISTLREVGFDEVVNLQPSFKTWLLLQLLKPRRQAVYQKEKLEEKGLAQRAMTRLHAIEDFYRPFQQLYGLKNTGLPLSRLAWDEKYFYREGPWVGILPGVGRKRASRAWPLPAYWQLIRQLLQVPNLQIHLFGGQDEYLLGINLQRSLDEEVQSRIHNHCGTFDLAETALWMSQCHVIVGGDTGPLHLATAVGVPVVGLYGPTSVARTGPVARQTTVLLPPESLECWPCELPRCPLIGNQKLACMNEISVEQVLQACLRYLKA